jgi:hypothetical protein
MSVLSPTTSRSRKVRLNNVWVEFDAETWPIVHFDVTILNIWAGQQQHLIHPVALACDGFQPDVILY